MSSVLAQTDAGNLKADPAIPKSIVTTRTSQTIAEHGTPIAQLILLVPEPGYGGSSALLRSGRVDYHSMPPSRALESVQGAQPNLHAPEAG